LRWANYFFSGRFGRWAVVVMMAIQWVCSISKDENRFINFINSHHNLPGRSPAIAHVKIGVSSDSTVSALSLHSNIGRSLQSPALQNTSFPFVNTEQSMNAVSSDHGSQN
jgi:hypothetical protein